MTCICAFVLMLLVLHIRSYAAEWEDMGNFTITHYCSCKKCCGGNGLGITYSGAKATEDRTVAVDKKVIPIGTKLYIEGYGFRYAEDTGSAVRGKHIDIFTGNDHEEARKLGKLKRKVWIVHEETEMENETDKTLP